MFQTSSHLFRGGAGIYFRQQGLQSLISQALNYAGRLSCTAEGKKDLEANDMGRANDKANQTLSRPAKAQTTQY